MKKGSYAYRRANNLCGRCGSNKPVQGKTTCRKCRAKRYFRYDLKKRYGITWTEYYKRLRDQGRACVICGAGPKRGSRGRLYVDHSPNDGKVRALLCKFCNLALGAMQERPDLLRRAADYLEYHNAI